GLPYVDRLFVTELYFEKLTPELFQPWERGWPVDLRGDEEVAEQHRHDLILDTRPRHRRARWWEHAHQVEESAHSVGVPGPLDLQTEIALPAHVRPPVEPRGCVVFHNDPAIDPRKAWPWEHARAFVRACHPTPVIAIGGPGPELPRAVDLRGRTTLAEAAALIRGCRGYVGIDSGLMWIAASLQAPVVGLYGTAYLPNCSAVQPHNPQARYLHTEGLLDSLTPEAVLAAARACFPHP
ncbi:MAG: glycosyltransferase family 9 protein, partial [Armatimonadetes bacterium]|nr:glycosyltransferase family 9 protein [Armatimonadota bacterium]